MIFDCARDRLFGCPILLKHVGRVGLWWANCYRGFSGCLGGSVFCVIKCLPVVCLIHCVWFGCNDWLGLELRF
jgi:hypothetical protein